MVHLKEIKESIQIEKIRQNNVMNKVLDKISHSKKTSKVEEIQNIRKFFYHFSTKKVEKIGCRKNIIKSYFPKNIQTEIDDYEYEAKEESFNFKLPKIYFIKNNIK